MYQSHEWFRVLLKQTNGDGLAVAVIRDNQGAIRGLCPVQLQSTRVGFQILGRIRWARLFSAVTILGNAPLWDSSEPELMRLFIRATFQHFRSANAIKMSAVSPTSEFGRIVYALLPRAGVDYIRGNYHTLPFPPTLVEHQKRFGPKRRYNYRREQRLLEAALGPLVEFHLCSETDVRAGLNRLEAAEKASVSDAERGFIGVIRRRLSDSVELAAAGLCKSMMVCCGDRIVAYVVAYQYGHRVHFHKTEMNPELIDYSPGSLATYLFGISVYEPDALGRSRPTDVVFGFSFPNITHFPNNIIEDRSKLIILRPGIRNSLFRFAFRNLERAKQLLKRIRGARS